MERARRGLPDQERADWGPCQALAEADALHQEVVRIDVTVDQVSLVSRVLFNKAVLPVKLQADLRVVY